MIGKKQPKEMFFLAITELCQRFTFWGVANLLVLYLTKKFDFPIAKATHLFGLFTGISFILPVVGGQIAKRWNYLPFVIIGCLVSSFGCFLISIGTIQFLYIGLIFIATGMGLFTPSVYALLGEVYANKHRIRAGGFSIYYSFINMGVFLAMLFLGSLYKRGNWEVIFIIAGSVQLIGIIPLLFGIKLLKSITFPKCLLEKREKCAPIHHYEFERMIVIGILSLVSMIFWMAFNQLGSSIILFIDQFVDHYLFGFLLPSPWFLSIESLALIVFAIPLVSLYLYLHRIKSPPNPIIKTALSLFFMALCFLILVRASKSSLGELINPTYILFALLLMGIAELLIAPIGLFLITHLSPRPFSEMLIGLWYLCSGLGFYFGGLLAGLMSVFKLSQFFNIFVTILILTACLLFIFARKLNRMRHLDRMEQSRSS